MPVRSRAPRVDPRASALAADVSFLLARANALSLGVGNTALAAFGLKVRSFSVLSLAVDATPPSQRDLAAALRLDPSQVVALVDELERAGLVRREPDSADRRANVVVATPAGRALHAEAAAVTLAAERGLFDALSDGERVQLAGLLRRIAFADMDADPLVSAVESDAPGGRRLES